MVKGSPDQGGGELNSRKEAFIPKSNMPTVHIAIKQSGLLVSNAKCMDFSI